MVYLGVTYNQRNDQQCFVRGLHGLTTHPFIPNKGKTLQQLSKRGIYLEIIWSFRVYLCNIQCFASGSHGHPMLIFSLIWAQS